MVVREHLTELGGAIGCPELSVHQPHRQRQGERCDRREDQRRGTKARDAQQQPPEKESDSLEGVLRAGQHRDPAIERRLVILRSNQLDRALGAHLRQILRDTGERLRDHHVRNDEQRHRGQAEHQQREDLDRQAHRQRDPEAEASSKPAPEQVGNDAGHLIEDEQRGDLQRRVAELVEVEQHQRARRPIDERLGPVSARSHGVVAEVDASPSRSVVSRYRLASHPRHCRAPGRAQRACSRQPFAQARRDGSRSPTRCRTTRGSSPESRRSPSLMEHRPPLTVGRL